MLAVEVLGVVGQYENDNKGWRKKLDEVHSEYEGAEELSGMPSLDAKIFNSSSSRKAFCDCPWMRHLLSYLAHAISFDAQVHAIRRTREDCVGRLEVEIEFLFAKNNES